MKTLTNHTAGPKGINLKDGTTRWLEPGETAELDAAEIVGTIPDLGKAKDAEPADGEMKVRLADLEAENAALKAKLAALDGDGNGDPGGSKPQDPPALSGKIKAELLAIAEDEEVEIEDGATNDDIKAAIELAREKKAAAKA